MRPFSRDGRLGQNHHGARRDLHGIHAYISENDSPESVDHGAGNIVGVIEMLREMPTRGVHPAELEAFVDRKYHELFFKPYQILNTIGENVVDIALIADDRRDEHTVLANRLPMR